MVGGKFEVLMSSPNTFCGNEESPRYSYNSQDLLELGFRRSMQTRTFNREQVANHWYNEH